MDFVFHFNIASDAIVKSAIYISIISIILVIVLAIWVVILRIQHTLRTRRKKYITDLWGPILAKTAVGDKVPTPPLAYSDTYAFLSEWNNFYGIVRGENITKLKRLAEKLRIDYYAKHMLKSKRLHDRLLAAVTLGHMREYSAWDDLIEMLDAKQSVAALTAACSLLLIDPKLASATVLPTLITHKNWPWSNVAHALKLAGPANVCTPLAELAKNASPSTQTRLLRYMEIVKCEIVSNAVTNILKTTKDDRVASVCLHIVRDTEALPVVRQYLDHPRWHVRMHAATALGKISDSDDIPRLLKMLEDREWWVRYRSAQAIAALASYNKHKLEQLREQVQDKYGRDILTQVIAEIRDTR